jgi:hypothetical protein
MTQGLTPKYFGHDENQDRAAESPAQQQIKKHEANCGHGKNDHWTPQLGRTASMQEIPRTKRNCAVCGRYARSPFTARHPALRQSKCIDSKRCAGLLEVKIWAMVQFRSVTAAKAHG